MWSFVFEWNSTSKHVVLGSRSKYTKIVLNMYLIKRKLIYYIIINYIYMPCCCTYLMYNLAIVNIELIAIRVYSTIL